MVRLANTAILSLSGGEYPVRPPADAQMKSPIKVM